MFLKALDKVQPPLSKIFTKIALFLQNVCKQHTPKFMKIRKKDFVADTKPQTDGRIDVVSTLRFLSSRCKERLQKKCYRSISAISGHQSHFKILDLE